MTAPMRKASAATAPTTIPAIAPVDGPELGVSVGDVVEVEDASAGSLDEELMTGMSPVVIDKVDDTDVEVTDSEEVLVVELSLVVVDDALLVLGREVVNKERSLCWKATVIGWAHIVIRPDTSVKNVVVPSIEDVITSSPPSSANTVVALASVKMLVHPKYCAVTPPALTVLMKFV